MIPVRRLGPMVVGVAAMLAAPALRADEFDRIEGEALAAIVRSGDAAVHSSLTIGELDALPKVLGDSRSAFLVVKTGQGNIARLLLSPALRKTPGGQGAPIPVLLIERFDTFETGNLATRLARGKDIVLFDGFQFDLDSGQVVPEGQGGDLKFEGKEKSAPRLLAAADSRIFTLTRAPATTGAPAAGPTPGRTVVPRDFAGRYRLFSNGQWSGLLELKIAEGGLVSGRFRSDLNGSSYPVSGQVAADQPHRIAFTVTLPRTKQEFEGLLWTEGKGAMAGTMTMLDRAYGFFALREGGQFAPVGEDQGPVARESSKPGRRTVTLRKGQYTLDGQPKTDQELTDGLKRAVAGDPNTWVLLQVPSEEPYSAVSAAFDVVAGAGVTNIRIAPADPER